MGGGGGGGMTSHDCSLFANKRDIVPVCGGGDGMMRDEWTWFFFILVGKQYIVPGVRGGGGAG